MTTEDVTLTVRVAAKNEKAIDRIIDKIAAAINKGAGEHLTEGDDGSLISITSKKVSDGRDIP